MKGRDMVTVRNDLAGVVVPKGYKKVALNHPPGPSEFSPYRCVERLTGLLMRGHGLKVFFVIEVTYERRLLSKTGENLVAIVARPFIPR